MTYKQYDEDDDSQVESKHISDPEFITDVVVGTAESIGKDAGHKSVGLMITNDQGQERAYIFASGEAAYDTWVELSVTLFSPEVNIKLQEAMSEAMKGGRR